MSRISLVKRNPDLQPPADKGQRDLVLDLDGNMGTRDEFGDNRFGNFDGSPQTYAAQVSRPALVDNAAVFFGELVGSITQVFARLQDNSVLQVTGAGDARALNWKGGTPGSPYVNGDTAVAVAGQMIMVDVGSGETVTVNVPSSLANTGRSFEVFNTNDKDAGSNGDVVFHPLDASDKIGSQVSAGGDALIDGSGGGSADINGIMLRSDGFGGWRPMLTGQGDVLAAV